MELDKYIEKSLTSRTYRAKRLALSVRLTQLLNQHKITSIPQLCEDAKISRPAFYRVENGDGFMPSISILTRLSLAMKLSYIEYRAFLKKAEYEIPPSNGLMLVMHYCLDNKIYAIDSVNEILKSKDLETI